MKFQRAILEDVEGYVPGEQPKRAGVIKLNTNENPYPPSPAVLDALQAISADQIRKYPDPLAVALREEIARRYGFAGPDWILAGNGMDELLAMALRTFVDPGEAVLTTYPTYTLYRTLARLHGARCIEVDLDDSYQLPRTFYATPARLCFLPRPNAPSGVCAPKAAIEEFCGAFEGLIIIDEAYVDFADDDCMDLARRFENTIVMRTFSKSFSLAGLRLGFAAASPDIITELLKTKDSYNLNAATQAAGLAALRDYEYMRGNVVCITETRRRLSKALAELGFDVSPSQSNFLLARRYGEPSAQEVFMRLKEKGIYVRYFDAPRLSDCLRITIGTDHETDALLLALKEILPC